MSDLVTCHFLAAFHFWAQSSLSVSSMLRALAYSLRFNRAASQRSALVNSCVDTTAPLTAPPIKLTTIKTWTILSLPTALVSHQSFGPRKRAFSYRHCLLHHFSPSNRRPHVSHQQGVLGHRSQHLRCEGPLGGSSIQSRMADGEIARRVG